MIPELGSLLKIGKLASLVKALTIAASITAAVLTWVSLREYLGPATSILAAIIVGVVVLMVVRRLLNLNTF